MKKEKIKMAKETRKKTMSFYCDESYEERIKDAAEKEDRTKNKIAEMVMEAGLKKLGW